MDSNSKDKQLVKNTLMLSFQMALVIIINLYSVRVLLKTLGVDDFGIYNVVGGVVTMFSFLASSMTSGAQRFFAIEIGKNDKKRLSEIFNATNLVYWLIAFILFVLLETFGLWFLNTQMNFETSRSNAVNWVYQFSILTFIINVISIPYNALIISHEKMYIYSLLNLVDNILKLIAVILLSFMNYDKLILYSGLISLFSIITKVFYQMYCKYKFIESHFFFYWERGLIKSLLSYSWFNAIGSVALITRNQGINILLNIFFGTTVNAARGVAMQVSNIVNSFVSNLYFSSRPQITKYYSVGADRKMWNIVFQSTKASYYLLMLISIPLLLEIDYILNIWLGDYPEYVPIFVRLTLIMFLIEATSNQLVGVLQAANKIKCFQIISSGILLLNIPVAYLILELGFSPVAPFVSTLIISSFYVLSLVCITKKEVGLNIIVYRQMLINLIIVTLLSSLIPFLFSIFFHIGFMRLVGTVILSSFCSGIIIWFVGMNSNERKTVFNFINNKIHK